MRCECSDPGCAVHKGASSCENAGAVTLYRVDMEDRTGSRLCAECCEDAYESGLFRTEEDEPDDEDEPTEPDEGDYTLTPTGPLGSQIGVGKHGERFLGAFPDTDEALAFVRADMEASKFWPNVWWVSDHGNAWTIDATTGKEAR